MSRRSPTSGEEPGPPGVLIFDSVAPTAAAHIVQFSRGKYAGGSQSLGRSGCQLMAGFDGIRDLASGVGRTDSQDTHLEHVGRWRRPVGGMGAVRSCSKCHDKLTCIVFISRDAM
jgi:hypothetical protein